MSHSASSRDSSRGCLREKRGALGGVPEGLSARALGTRGVPGMLPGVILPVGALETHGVPRECPDLIRDFGPGRTRTGGLGHGGLQRSSLEDLAGARRTDWF